MQMEEVAAGRQAKRKRPFFKMYAHSRKAHDFEGNIRFGDAAAK
jgi:hypothetical protein